jgi:hypothetical protein
MEELCNLERAKCNLEKAKCNLEKAKLNRKVGFIKALYSRKDEVKQNAKTWKIDRVNLTSYGVCV